MSWLRKKKKEAEEEKEIIQEAQLAFIYAGEDREKAVDAVEEIIKSRQKETLDDIKHRISNETVVSKLELQLENEAVLEKDSSKDTFKGNVYFLEGNILKIGLVFEGKVEEGVYVKLKLETKNSFKNIEDSPFELILQVLERYGYKELPISEFGPSRQE